MNKLLYEKETYLIKKACIETKEKLGIGFLEKVYENALKLEIENLGLDTCQELCV